MQLFRIEPASAESQARPLHFGPHRLAGPHGPLSSRGVDVKLRPKALAVLWTLASDPGRVHTKSALLDAVWGETAVGEDALTFQIQALRQALADDARCPRYIETVHRIGYRFISPVGTGVPVRQPPAAMGWYEAEVHRLAAELLRLLEARRSLAG